MAIALHARIATPNKSLLRTTTTTTTTASPNYTVMGLNGDGCGHTLPVAWSSDSEVCFLFLQPSFFCLNLAKRPLMEGVEAHVDPWHFVFRFSFVGSANVFAIVPHWVTESLLHVHRALFLLR